MGIKKIVNRIVMTVLFLLIIVSFAFLGMSRNLFSQVQPNTVAVVAGEKITRQEYSLNFTRALQNLSQQNQREITKEEAVANGFDQSLLQSLVTNASVNALAHRLGLRPSLKMFSDQLRQQPQFFDQVTGKFDRATYENVLRENDLTPTIFEHQVMSDLSQQPLMAAIAAGIKAPAIYAAFGAAIDHETRDLSAIMIDPRMVGPSTPPTDAELAQLLKDQNITVPAQRALTVVHFSTDAVKPTVKVDEKQIEDLFNFRKDQASTAETRSFVQITAKNEAAAKTIAERLAKGDDPDKVAKDTGSTIVHQDAKPKTAIPDAKVADAVFSLNEGQASGPIQGDLGLAVVKVTQITAGQAPDLDALRDQIRSEAVDREAARLVSEAADKFQDALDAGQSLDAAAAAAGPAANLFHTDPVTAQGTDLKLGKPAPGVTPRIAQEAFQLTQGAVSDVITISQGEYAYVRADKIIPEAPAKLEDFREQATKNFYARQLQDRMQKIVDDITDRLNKGETLEQAASAHHAAVDHITGLSRQAAQQAAQTFGGQLVQSALDAKAGDVISGTAAPRTVNGKPVEEFRMYVAKVDKISGGDPDAAAQEANQIVQGFGQQLGDEVTAEVRRAAATRVKPTLYLDRAREAIGAEAPKADDSAPAPDAKAPTP